MNVVFVTHPPSNVTNLKFGARLVEYYKQFGDSRFNYIHTHRRHAPEFKDSVLIFIKCPAKVQTIERAKRNGNRLILHTSDCQFVASKKAPLHLFDAIGFSNKRMMKEYVNHGYKGIADIVYEYWEPVLQPVTGKWDIAVATSISSCDIGLLKKLGVKVYHRLELPAIRCWISIRQDGTNEFKYKPPTKVVTAAAQRTNIVLTRDWSHLDLLGERYPYYCDGSILKVAEAIGYARGTFGSRTWREALQMMEHVKSKTRVWDFMARYDKIVKDVLDVQINN